MKFRLSCLMLVATLSAPVGGNAQAQNAGPGIASALSAPGKAPWLASVYGPRNNQPIWTDGSGTPTAGAKAAIELIRAADQDGLNPQAYGLANLDDMAKATPPADSAKFELALSQGLGDYLHDLATGHTPVGPMRDETFVETADRGALLNAVAALSADDLTKYAAGLDPAEPDYAALRKALVDLRAQKAAGGWQPIPDGPSLKPGMKNAVIPALRVRLSQPEVQGKAAQVYDDALAGAVKAFQQTHAIKDDATLGHDTRAALDMSVDARIAEVIAAMERWRWLPHDLGPRYVMVNVGGYWARYVNNGQLALQNPVIVGREERETPLLQSEIEDAVLNPTWTVPPTIIKKDVIPGLRADPEYLEKKGIKLYRRTDGGLEEVRDTSDFRGGSDYVLRQPAGEENALGQYKLLFQNKYSIYMHDTPEKKKFTSAIRNFSSGCIRVQKVRQFIDALLDGQMTTDQIQSALDTGKTKTIKLARPLPVYIDYFSAWLGPDGGMIFGPDEYAKDQELADKVLAAGDG